MSKSKIVGIILTTVIACSAFASGRPQAAPTGSASGFNASGMPIFNQPVELHVLTMRWGDMGDSFVQNAWLRELERRTNVRIRWQTVSNNGWDEQRSLLLASGRLPDIILGSETFRDVDIMNNLEYFRPLDTLIDQYMPNYKRALIEYPAFRQVTTYPDGRMYSLANNLPKRPATRNHWILNKTWLDKLGLAIPNTLDEYTNVLRQFKAQDANGNGNTNDEFPLAFYNDGNPRGSGVVMDIFNPFGITDIYGSGMSIGKDGRPFPIYTSENYKAGVRWLRTLWQEGLIDPESFTQNWSMVTGKRMNAAAPLVGAHFAWTPDSDFGQWSSQYVAIPPLVGPDGGRYVSGDPDGIFAIARNQALITTFCQYPEAAARWLDEFYTNEASIQNFWGAIGTVIRANSNGTYSLNDPPAGTSADAWYWDQSLRDFGPKYVQAGFNDFIILSPTSGDGFKWEISRASDPYVVKPFPRVIFTQRESDEIESLSYDIDVYIAQTMVKWITQGGIDAEWDAYIARLNQMGFQRILQLRMDAYNRYTNPRR
ncbi:MAG: extracellular solute-binding protein [Treponema sp.]|nr:extracellular solute-binding protein [Treponema sp.]